MQTWENVYVFISSTFNDMHAERDYLVKRVFPELSEWCEERKLRLVDVDLRWGVTEKDSQENKRVVEVCLANIDRCRPLFMCFLGQRRGWVPERGDISDATFDAFPKLDDYLGSSVTEMEITHALIDPMLNGSVLELKNRERAFFFMRDPGYLDDITDQNIRNVYTNEAEANPLMADYHMEEFKEQVRETGRPTFEYSATWDARATTPELLAPGKPAGIDQGRLTDFRCDGHELADVVISQIKEALEELYPGREPAETATPLQRELDEQARFLQFAQEGFIERAGDFDEIERFIESADARPCAIVAPAGMGKTSYLARLVERLQNGDARNVMYRFIGTSAESVSLGSLLASLVGELSDRFGVKYAPVSPQQIKERLPTLLARAATEKPLVVVIDAINQLDTSLDDLSWIPALLPAGVKFIYSFKLGEAAGDTLCQQLQDQGETRVMHLRGFQGEADRAALVNEYLSLYLKELDESNIDDVISSAGAENPLFLKVLLSELRVFGSHEGLRDRIAGQFGTTPQTAFDDLLARLETDPMYSSVPARDLAVNLFGWLSHSKNGLEPRDMTGLLVHAGLAADEKDARDCVNLMLRQLRAFLAKRDKRQDFFYESFLLAARERYASPDRGGKPDEAWHAELAEYFQSLDDADARKTFELAYQCAHAGMTRELVALLTSFEHMERRIGLSGVQELAQDFALADLPQAGVSESGRQQLALIREALEMAAPIVGNSLSQLAGQLFGRLMGFEAPLVWQLLEDAERTLAARKQPWLKPLCTHLPQPGSRIVRYYKTTVQNGVGLFRDRARMALCSTDDKAVKVVEIATGRVLRSFPLRNDPQWVCLCEDDNVLAVREMNTLRFMNLSSGQVHEAPDVAGMASSHFDTWNGLLVCTGDEPGSKTGTAYVVNVATGALAHRFIFRKDAPEAGMRNAYSAAFDPETGLLFMSIEDIGFAAYDPQNGFDVVRRYRNPDCESEARMRANKLLLPQGTPFLVTIAEYDGLTIYDKHSGRVLAHRRALNVVGTHVAVSPDNTTLAHASFARVELLSLDTFETICRIDAGNARNPISSLAFSADGARLFVGRDDGAIEVWNVSTQQMADAFTEAKGRTTALYPETCDSTMVSQQANQVVVWKQRAAAKPDAAVFSLPVNSAALSPDGAFVIATTLASDGAIYRIDVPSMECRPIVDSIGSYFAYKDATITCDSRHFGVTQHHNEFKVFDAETGEPAGELTAIDALQTGDVESQWISNPRFLPEPLSHGQRNLTVLYEQFGHLIMQDPDEPESVVDIDVFPGSIGWSRLFDGGTKIAMRSSGRVFDAGVARLKRRDDASLLDGTKVFDLVSGECIAHTDDWESVYLRSLELGGYPSVTEPVKVICRLPGRMLFHRKPLPSEQNGESWGTAPFVVWDSSREKPLCSYVGSWQALLPSDDGRHVFLVDRDTLHPFSLENLPDAASPLRSESDLDHLGLALFEKGGVENVHEAYLVYSELVERFPEKDHHAKNRSVVERKLKVLLDEMSKANDVAGIERYYDRYRTLADEHPGDESYLALLNYTQGKLAFRLSIRDDMASKQRACRLYSELVERHYDEERNQKNLDITLAQIAALQAT